MAGAEAIALCFHTEKVVRPLGCPVGIQAFVEFIFFMQSSGGS